LKGYAAADLHDPWQRYVPLPTQATQPAHDDESAGQTGQNGVSDNEAPKDTGDTPSEEQQVVSDVSDDGSPRDTAKPSADQGEQPVVSAVSDVAAPYVDSDDGDPRTAAELNRLGEEVLMDLATMRGVMVELPDDPNDHKPYLVELLAE
jgi:hypothetical protein